MSNERSPELVLSAERLVAAGVARHAAERVVLRRRVVTEVRRIEVTVRREELVVERAPVDGGLADVPADVPADHLHEPLIIILSREVPYVELRTEPYERVTATVHDVTRDQVMTAPVRVEQAQVDVLDVTGPS